MMMQQDVARDLLYNVWHDIDFGHNYIMVGETWQDRCVVYEGML